MKQFIPRWLQGRVERALQAMPVVVLAGARQTGKSTLVRYLDPKRRYLTLDDLDVLDQARRDPDSLLAHPPLTLDEVQRAPELLLALKRRVDEQRRSGDYLLTGSAQFALMRNVADSLAGRAVYLDLNPFCPLEWLQAPNAAGLIGQLFEDDPDYALWESSSLGGDWMEWVLRGGFAPALESANSETRALWFGGYVQTYLERDLRELSDVSSLPDFQRMMRIAAQRTGRLLNQAEVARDTGISHATCHRYLNLLETGYQIARLKPYAANPTTALVKSAKLFWSDSGLASWLAGMHDRAALQQRADSGFWLEQVIFQTLQSWRATDPFGRRLSYWRTRGGDEVDFVLEDEQRCVAIEIKAASRVGTDDVRGLRRFADSQGKAAKLVRSVVLYGGSDIRFLGDHVMAIPYAALFPPMAPPVLCC